MRHLLAIAIGPVQEFIAAARRTRDLWFGSHVLSEVSRAVAKEVESQRGTLIFPASWDADNVANLILAELGTGDPNEVAATAKRAAQDRWRVFAEKACGLAPNAIRADIWKDQVDDVIEFYAAWVPHTDPKNYRIDRARVMRLLDGRKNCRDFKQPGLDDTGLAKSSLDGQRPTVLKGPKPGESRETYRDGWPKKLRLSPGEQLDVVGVTKRLGEKQGESDARYPSVARVAAETWLRGAKEREGFAELRNACAAVTRLNKVAEPHYSYFPYEGTVIFQYRHADLINELGEEAREPLKRVAKALERLGGEPNPYLAILVADGDKIGAAISSLDSVVKHRAFSGALAGFAGEARGVVNDHSGVMIYAGGDDVLAFLPVDRCLACARGLYDRFGELLANYNDEKGNPPTLSVGLAIGHFMENLEDLLGYGRAAEKHAKEPDRDGLAVHLYKRGGAPIKVRATWTEGPEVRMLRYSQALNQAGIPGRLAYELRQLAQVYEGWPEDTEEERKTIGSAISQDVKRVLSRKRQGGSTKVSLDVDRIQDPQLLKQFAAELLIARQIATALPQAEEDRAPVAEAAT